MCSQAKTLAVSRLAIALVSVTVIAGAAIAERTRRARMAARDRRERILLVRQMTIRSLKSD
jgi:hypothetical protein